MVAIKTAHPLFTFFCIGLASSLLAASLLLAPCGVVDARATTANDLNLSGDVQVNLEGNTINETIQVDSHDVGMGVNSHNTTTHKVSLTNKGTISLQAGTQTTYGIFADHQPSGSCQQEDFIEVTNEGSIIVSATGASPSVTGISATDHHPNANITVNNYGSITASSNSAQGIYAHIDESVGNITVNSTGPIIINSTGGESYGIRSTLSTDGRNPQYITFVNNSGPITVTGQGELAAIQTTPFYESTTNINNSGNLTVHSSDGSAIGIKSQHNSSSSFNMNMISNSGIIKVTSQSTACTRRVCAAGIAADQYNPSPHDITNEVSGIINVEGYDNIYGIYSDTYSKITNNGIITVTGTEGMYNPPMGVHGIYTWRTATNNGTITVSDVDSDVYGISIIYASYGTAPSNNGIINITSDNGAAYGFYLQNSSNATVSNTGTINLDGKTAEHELFLNGSATIGTWTITLRDYEDTTEDNKYDPFAIQNGQITFSRTRIPNFAIYGAFLPGTTFIVTPGTAEEGFAFNKEFPIQDMICKYDYSGNPTNPLTKQDVVGAVGFVESAVPFLKAELLHGDVASDYEFDGNNITGIADDQIEQTIIIRAAVSPETSPGHEVEDQIATSLTQNMNMLCSILDTQLDYDELPEDWRAFAIPYYTHGVNYDFGYDTDIMGIALGATHRMSDRFSAGAHLNFATIDTESDATQNDAFMAGLGVHAKYHITDNFHIRGQVTGFVMENNASMSMLATPEKVTSDVDTTSLGMYAALFAAYDYKANEHHTFTPELALKYIYAETDGFGSDWYKADGTRADHDIRYDDVIFDELYAEASLRWKGNFDLGTMENGKHRGVLHPTMRAGVRQALMGAEVESKLHYNNFDLGTTTSHANETSALFEAGLEWVVGDTTTSLSYIADFGNTEESHMALLKVEFEF